MSNVVRFPEAGDSSVTRQVLLLAKVSLTDRQRRVAIVVACLTHENGGSPVRVTDSELAKLCGMSRQALNTAKQHLIAKNILSSSGPGWRRLSIQDDPDKWELNALHDLCRKENIPVEVRRFVYRRDGYKCLKCKSTSDLTVDHIYPESLGGSCEPGNLQTLCRACNLKKGASV